MTDYVHMTETKSIKCMTETKSIKCSRRDCGARADDRRTVLAALGWYEAEQGLLFCGQGCSVKYNDEAPRYGHAPVQTRPVMPDTPATTEVAKATAERDAREVTVHLKCEKCSARFEFIGMRDADGKVMPDPLETAATLGAVMTSRGWACSATCAEHLNLAAARSRAVKVPDPVTVINDASYQRRRLERT